MFGNTEKNYESYYHFFSTLVKLVLRIVDIIAVGTDRETAIVQALKATLHGNTIYLCCFLYKHLEVGIDKWFEMSFYQR